MGTETGHDLGLLTGPVLVFGGPYSNLAATQAMQQVARQRDIPAARVICTGDLVAYCAEPQATVDLIRDWGIPVVMGNCEESLAAGAPDCGCGFDENSACSLLSVQWYRYASQQLSQAHKHWMATLPRQLTFSLNGQRFTVVHGSLNSINRFVFASGDNAAKQQQLADAGADVMIGGHCGLPFGQAMAEGAWLNSGVIGMPANDASPDGWYLLLTPNPDQTITASWHRLAYDVAASAAAMISAGLDNPYAQALQSGLWPSTDILPTLEAQQTGQRLHLPELRLVRR